MFSRLKPARKIIIRTSVLVGLTLISGCQQQVRPPVTEIPKAEIPQSSSSQASESSEGNQEPELPNQIDWNRRSREITRTELSPITRQIPPTRKVDIDASQTSGLSIQQQTRAIPVEIAPSIQPLDEKSAMPVAPIASIESTELKPIAPIVVEPPNETIQVIENPIEKASAKLSQNEPESAILTINTIDPKPLSDEQRAAVLRIKAQAYRQLDMSIAALRFDAERLRYLHDSALNVAALEILEKLEELPDRLLQDLSVGTDLLAGMAHAFRLRKTRSEDGILQWLRKYRTHPLLKANIKEYEFLTAVEPPKDFDITVLLPLSGDLANAGRAVRDGILFEYQQQQAEVGVALNIIDTENLSNSELTTIGQSTNAEFIIGPLRKDKVIKLVGSRPRIPILVLNRVKTDLINRSSPAYSLSLAIEDDAESTVNQIARQADRPRVVVFHADSPLGLRASEAINKQLILVGGSSGGKFALDKEKPEIAITEAFGVTDSDNRRREMSKMLGLRLEHTPRIRQDMTAVVVHTDPKKAQQIRPLLDFYYLGPTPVYLIGAYRPDLKGIAEDLRNTQLMVTPWDLGTVEKEALAGRVNAQGIFGSLVGVGIDAMRMAIQLGFGGSTSIQGQSGYLTLGSDSIIHRQLSMIQITNKEQIQSNLWEPSLSLLQMELLDAEQ
ncbi:MAG: Penicillin-binding protein activator LpoA [Gammaproteobacteria bacterium]|nr:MAG: Penicillin-binding protein activator LpoA [Gammaproteobacteria bacterium]